VIVSILRVLPLTQTVDYVPYDAFPAQTHEGALDKLTMIDQQLQEQIDRALKLPVESIVTDIEITNVVNDALVEFDTTTKPGTLVLTSGPTATQVAQDADDAQAAAAAASSSAASAAASAQAAAAAASNISSSKYEEVVATAPKSVFVLPFQISTLEENVAIFVNGVCQPTSAYVLTNSTTVTLSEALPVGTTFMLASVNPQALPDLGDYVKKVATPAPVVGDALVFSGGGLWTPSAPRHKNFFINGGMAVAQRGAVAASGAEKYGGCDRMTTFVAGWTTGSIAQFPSVGDPVSGWAHGIDTLSFANGYAAFGQKIEANDSIHFDGKTITFNCRVFQSCGENFPATVVFYKPQTSKDNWTGAPPQIVSKAFTLPLQVWTDMTLTHTVAANDAINGWMVKIFIGDGATTVSNKAVFTGAWQLEIGSVATPFEFRPFAEELALCQRYYEKSYNLDVSPGAASNAGSEVIYQTGLPVVIYGMGKNVVFKTRKRAQPTITIHNPVTGQAGVVYDAIATQGVPGTVDIEGATAFQLTCSTFAASTNVYLRWQWVASAEL
jgi:hypothetical protein